jgi:acyl carrier protein
MASMATAIKSIDKCKNATIKPTTTFKELGLDSLEMVDLISVVEEKEKLTIEN